MDSTTVVGTGANHFMGPLANTSFVTIVFNMMSNLDFCSHVFSRECTDNIAYDDNKNVAIGKA